MIRLAEPRHCIHLESVLRKRTVRMKVYPVTEYEELDRDVATHLYRLLQRYNWSLEDYSRYRDRWAAFWPSITVIERKALALFIMSNTGTFGTRVEIENLPVGLEALKGQFDPVVLRSNVEAELKRLVGRFYASLAQRDELATYLAINCKNEFRAIARFGGVSLVYEDGLLLPDDFEKRCVNVLRSARMRDAEAHYYALRLHLGLEEYLILKEMKVWQ